MDEITTGIKRLFWNPDEKRLRALFRIPVALGLALLALQLIFGAVRLVLGSQSGPLVSALLAGLLTGAVVAIAWFIDRRYRRDMGLSLGRRWWLEVVAGLVVGVGMVATIVVVLRVVGMAQLVDAHPVTNATIVLGEGSTTRSLAFGLLFFAATGALEEVVIRGYLLTNVAEGIKGYVGTARTAVVIAVVGTAALFGVLHAANPGGTALSFLNITLAGVFFGAAYAVTTSIAFPIGLHVAWNFTLGPVFGLPVSGLQTDTALTPVQTQGPDLVTGGSFGPEGGLVMLAALAVGVGAFVWWVRRGGVLELDDRIAVPDLWIDEPADS